MRNKKKLIMKFHSNIFQKGINHTMFRIEMIQVEYKLYYSFKGKMNTS